MLLKRWNKALNERLEDCKSLCWRETVWYCSAIFVKLRKWLNARATGIIFSFEMVERVSNNVLACLAIARSRLFGQLANIFN